MLCKEQDRQGHHLRQDMQGFKKKPDSRINDKKDLTILKMTQLGKIFIFPIVKSFLSLIFSMKDVSDYRDLPFLPFFFTFGRRA